MADAIKASLQIKGIACAILGVADCVYIYTKLIGTVAFEPDNHVFYEKFLAWFIFQRILCIALACAFLVCGAASIHLSQGINFTKENALRCNKIWLTSRRQFVWTIGIFAVYAFFLLSIFPMLALIPGFILAAYTYSPVNAAVNYFKDGTTHDPHSAGRVPIPMRTPQVFPETASGLSEMQQILLARQRQQTHEQTEQPQGQAELQTQQEMEMQQMKLQMEQMQKQLAELQQSQSPAQSNRADALQP
jgi:hypothetical protein